MTGHQPAVRTVLALGSNLGDRLGYLQGGVRTLLADPGLRLAALSPVYATAPVGGPPQPDYLNAVLVADTTLTAAELLARCQATEAAFQRTRTGVWGPHPRARERAFVRAPWLDADPDAGIPGQGRVSDLLAAAGRAGVRRLDDVTLRPA